MIVEIEKSTQNDLSEIVTIYNWAIKNTTATFDTEEKSVKDQLAWFNSHDSQYPVIVAKNKGKVIAWGSLSQWSDRCAYSQTAEVSFYVHPDFHGQGIGSKLLKELVEIGKSNGLHTLLSRIADGSDVSIHLHYKMGFESIGILKEVGKKFGKLLNVTLMQRMLKE